MVQGRRGEYATARNRYCDGSGTPRRFWPEVAGKQGQHVVVCESMALWMLVLLTEGISEACRSILGEARGVPIAHSSGGIGVGDRDGHDSDNELEGVC